jgi:hypothetical protein
MFFFSLYSAGDLLDFFYGGVGMKRREKFQFFSQCVIIIFPISLSFAIENQKQSAMNLELKN